MEGYTLLSTSATQGILRAIFKKWRAGNAALFVFPSPRWVQSTTRGSSSWTGGPWRLRGREATRRPFRTRKVTAALAIGVIAVRACLTMSIATLASQC